MQLRGVQGPTGGSGGPLGVVGAPWGLKVANSGQNSHPSHSKTQNGQKSAVFGPLVAKICNLGGVPGYGTGVREPTGGRGGPLGAQSG